MPSCLAGSPGDTVPGIFCALSILAALLHRDVSGRGQRIDVAQTDSLMTLSGLALTRSLYTETSADDRAHQPSTMIHGVYEARDGYVAVRAIGEKALSILAETIGVEADELKPSSENLVKWFRERTRAEILGLLAEKIPCASVLNDEELVEDPNVVEREMIVEKHHPLGFTYRAVSTGIKFSETPVSIDELPPELGEDTVDVLHLLGYDDREIANMLDEEIIIGAGA